MRISIVTGFFLPVPPVLGGATEKIWHRLSLEFAARGHQVNFVSRAWPGFAGQETAGGVAHRRVKGADHSRFLAANLWQDLKWGWRVARVLPPADAVICNTVTLPAWLRRFRPQAGRVVAVVARMPKGHGRAYGRVDRLWALSEAVAERLRAENPRLAGRIAPFPYPMDWRMHAQAAGSEAPRTPLTIGFAGRIHPEKGVALLLSAACRLAAQDDLPPWRLKIIGPVDVRAGGGGGKWKASLLGQFGGSLGSRLDWCEPEFDAARLARHYGEMDVFCYPSLAEKGETFGLAVAEAMAARCAPVVSSLACFSELVRHGETGLVFEQSGPGADARLAEALAKLLADESLRRGIASRAQAFVKRYDFSNVAEQALADLERLRTEPNH
ncbi:MAG: glycosyltransferase family 4 protein [Opitutaceae bacterium]